MWVYSARVRYGCASSAAKRKLEKEKEPLVVNERKVGREVMRRERVVAKRAGESLNVSWPRLRADRVVLEGSEGRKKARSTFGEETRPERRDCDARRVSLVMENGGRIEGDCRRSDWLARILGECGPVGTCREGELGKG